jgi:WD40 repeat protein
MQEGAIGINVYPSLRMTLLTKNHRDFIASVDGDELLCLIYSAVNGYIYLGGNNARIQVWDMNSSEYVGNMMGHDDAVTCLTLDQNYLFSGSDDKTIRVWETVNNLPIYVLNGHTSSIRDVMIIPVSGSLVSCAHDGLICIWRYQSQEIIKQIDRSDELNCLAFISSINVILAGTESHAIITIPIEPEYGNPNGEDNTVDKATMHAEKKRKRAAGEKIPMSDDTMSVNSEDLLEDFPDKTEELLKQMLIQQTSNQDSE